MKNKEYGSDFEYIQTEIFYLKDKTESLFYGNQFSLFFSGRVALYNILKQGIEQKKWQQVYLPSFYCHEVTHYLKDLPVIISYYEFNPFLDDPTNLLEIDDVDSNVIINVDFYGIKKLDLKEFHHAILIEDITHNLLSFKDSAAHYCFGSLRKELPVPVGGFCFSPKGLMLPKGKPSLESEEIAAQKLSAMFLKSLYLKGEWDDKELFRKLYSDGEDKFEKQFTNTVMPEIAQSVLFSIESVALLQKKSINIHAALKNIKQSKELEINIQSPKFNVFGIILKCKDLETRNKLRAHLVQNRIYPAVLWPNQISTRDIEIENKILFLHVDYRYSLSDIEHITNIINEFI